jgi:putative aminopeptidase FrvX
MNKSVELLKELTLATGPSGFEHEVGEIIKKHLQGVGEITTDSIGNILCEIEGTKKDSKKVVLAAHQDEIGFMVSNIIEGGFLRFVTLGGWVVESLPTTAVTLINSDGQKIPGVIGQIPPHYKKGDAKVEVDSLYIDIGATSIKDVTESFKIEVGTIAVPTTNFHYNEVSNTVMSKAFDDRVGVAAMIELAHAVVKYPIESTLILAFTVQEEVGTRGAKVLSNYLKADVAVIVEGAPADDSPSSGLEKQTIMGKGFHYRAFDPTHISNPTLVTLIKKISKENKLANQIAVRRGGGTDASQLALAHKGIATIVVGVPVRYAHSPYSLISLGDYDSLTQLLYTVCATIGDIELP